MHELRYLPAGEQGLVVEFGNAISEEMNRRVHRLAAQLIQTRDSAILEVVPTYRSLLIYFDPLTVSREHLTALVRQLADADTTVERAADSSARVIRIPVCYGGEFGPDLEAVASHNGLTPGEVIKIHTATPYRIFMLGFTPGFPYLGGMSEKIATPRLEKPRVRIPAGSVGIAGGQTGFYPVESPGGWRLIGRTPILAFNPEAPRPFLFAPGDYLQFASVSFAEYQDILGQVETGGYLPTITSLNEGVMA